MPGDQRDSVNLKQVPDVPAAIQTAAAASGAAVCASDADPLQDPAGENLKAQTG